VPWFSDDETAGPGLGTPGIYRALLEQEQERCARIDPRTREHYRPEGGELTVVETGARSGALLEALEAGQPAVLQGRRLRQWIDLRRDQAFDLFEVRPDDSVRTFTRR